MLFSWLVADVASFTANEMLGCRHVGQSLQLEYYMLECSSGTDVDLSTRFLFAVINCVIGSLKAP
ncbi:hypothetical protein ACP4OV_027593 [Aristida adscensionis]